jgi:uncharacterized membrane protein
MKMIKSKHLYLIMIVVSIGYMLYVTYVNFIHDPQATDFLSHKTELSRSLNIPVWLNVMYVHLIFACMAMAAGAVNFAASLLRKHRALHRAIGYLYIVSVLIVCLTSGYMAPYSTGGKINSIAFNLVNMIWIGMTIAALVQIKRKQVNKHRKWMVRSYAFCFTNMFIHVFTFVLSDLFGLPYATGYTVGVYGTIVLNIALAELVIRYVYRKPTALQPSRK